MGKNKGGGSSSSKQVPAAGATDAAEDKKKKKGGGWKAQLEEEEKKAKEEEEKKLAIKNKIKFIRARHILHPDRHLLQDLRETILQESALGGSKASEEVFGHYAQECSECPSNVKGGLLGYFGKGQMDPNFEEVAFKTPVGQLSEVVESANGFHLIMVVETK